MKTVKPFISVTETLELRYADVDIMKVINGRISFEPSLVFETEFDVKAGEGEKLVQRLQLEEPPVYIESYTPSGLQTELKVIGLGIIAPRRPYPADTLKVVVDLTLDQLWAFAPPFKSAEFGY